MHCGNLRLYSLQKACYYRATDEKCKEEAINVVNVAIRAAENQPDDDEMLAAKYQTFVHDNRQLLQVRVVL